MLLGKVDRYIAEAGRTGNQPPRDMLSRWIHVLTVNNRRGFSIHKSLPRRLRLCSSSVYPQKGERSDARRWANRDHYGSVK